MTEGMSFSFPSLLFHEGRTYGQPEVVQISVYDTLELPKKSVRIP